MNAARRQGLSVEVTLLVALLLLVQAFFSGLSIGSKAVAAELATGVLCSTIGTRSAPIEQPAGRNHLVDCCTLGCSMVGGQPLPETAALPFATARPVAAGLRGRLDAAGLQRAELAPLHTRAPPRVS
ncbi:hypothetical protein OSH11_12175 [Kaistia dalseonensis]|uniref:DUF2946 domain-containing protein n=1 Tax=Kaistia dalseonensis TaxID=410840 RepID=A0ABU0H7Q7_9HYPH|nr:DUF2946 family protein [Kaistia dalseonensis]MCX5495466.1 hypothetical protein [Kaistia dalseonensis]MDQ0438057.1 hypothetical protein [Kaistia dalseonensis]